MIIDFHTHAFEDELAKKAIPILAELSGLIPYSDGTVKDILRVAKVGGADKIVISPVATKPSQQRKINDWASSINNGDIIAFGSIHPDANDALEELERIVALGLKGIKLHPEYQDFFVDEPRLKLIYEKIGKLGLIVIFHAGVDLGYEAPYHCTPEKMKNALPMLSGAHVIAAHLGGFRMWDEVEEHLCGKELYLDTAFTFGHIKSIQVERIIDSHGAEKILLGSDLPWHDTGKHMDFINQLNISDYEKNRIFGGNAQKLLGIS